MYKSIITISLLILMISFQSCRDKKENTFSGLITEMISGNVLSNVEIIIEVNELNSGAISTGYQEIAHVYTNEDGAFSCNTSAYQAINYKITFKKNTYHTRSIIITPQDIVGDYTINEEIGIKSYLKIHVKNTSPNNSNDECKYRLLGIHNNCNNCCNEDFHYFFGTDIDTTLYCPVTGLNTVDLQYLVIKDGSSQQYMQGLYCLPNDTVNINIFY